MIQYNNFLDSITIHEIRRCSFKNFLLKGKFKKYSKNGMSTSDFKINIGEIFNDGSRNLSVIDRKVIKSLSGQNKKMYRYHCNICNWDNGWKEECDLLHHKTGCSCCSNKVVVNGINDIPTIAPWMIEYFIGGYDEAKLYTPLTNNKVIMKCPYCNNITKTKKQISVVYRSHSVGCSCSDGLSYPEKFFISVLKQTNTDFVYQLSKTYFEWVGKYYYDFYLPKYNCIVETHGKQHYIDNNWSTSSLTNDNDKNKRILALNNGISKYIEIDCRNSDKSYILNSIENSDISKIIDLNNVDWMKCSEYATGNLVKSVCDFYKNNNYDNSKTAKHFNLSKGTIGEYLKRGNDLGWCIYPYHSYRKVFIFKNMDCIGKFSSTKDLERDSLKLFNVYLGASQIIRNCNTNKNGIIKEYKGFSFMFECDYLNM